METLLATSLLWPLVVLVVAYRAYATNTHNKHRPPKPPVHTMVVLGSGGHTAEMLGLLSALLPTNKYSPRTYVLADTDHTSARRVEAFEAEHATTDAHRASACAASYARLPRSREVGQSYFTSVFTTLYATLRALVVVFRWRPSLVLCNGPGTCIPICVAALLLRLLGIKRVSIVYVESIARVHSLSLSGWLLVHVADQFFVQWPDLVKRYPKCVYVGRLL